MISLVRLKIVVKDMKDFGNYLLDITVLYAQGLYKIHGLKYMGKRKCSDLNGIYFNEVVYIIMEVNIFYCKKKYSLRSKCFLKM